MIEEMFTNGFKPILLPIPDMIGEFEFGASGSKKLGLEDLYKCNKGINLVIEINKLPLYVNWLYPSSPKALEASIVTCSSARPRPIPK